MNVRQTVENANDAHQTHKKRISIANQQPSDHKRSKVTRACDQCKKRKRRCSGDQPCAVCLHDKQLCTYLSAYSRGKTVDPLPSYINCSRASAPSQLQATRSEQTTNSFIPQYLGPGSAHSFLRRAWKRFGKDEDISGTTVTEVQTKQGSIFQYGDRPSPDVRASLDNFPSPARAEHLLEWYFDVAAPTYRFLHRPTVAQWLKKLLSMREYNSVSDLSMSQQAVVILVTATAMLYELDTTPLDKTQMFRAWLDIEALYRAARQRLDEDTGRASLESIQARLSIIQYLLSTSRPNEAYYTFGTTVQLMYATGLHRSTATLGSDQDMIRSESRKRAFYVAYIADTYLSSMLGRPTLIRDEDVDQDYPLLVDDEDLTHTNAEQNTSKDSSMLAVVKHIELVRIAKKVLRMQTLGLNEDPESAYEAAVQYNTEIKAWREQLPVFLSGAVRPTSLITLFRRQVSVLGRCYAHAVMLVNRPFILADRHTQHHPDLIDYCLAAAKSCLDLVLESANEGSMFSAFWNTHYITFNALAVLYVWTILRCIGRLPSSKEVPDELDLFDRAEKVRGYLAEVTQSCAPSLRYGVVLEELQQEARQRLKKPGAGVFDAEGQPATSVEMPYSGTGDDNATHPTSSSVFSINEWQELGSDFPTDPSLWLHLDTFPFNEFFDS